MRHISLSTIFCFNQLDKLLVCTVDLNVDGSVNVTDLLLFTSQFGTASFCIDSDFNNDGTVNVGDLLLFSSVFGAICE
ncbi:MAG: hypothetical protein SH856_15315 [Flavobacteriales bacterium]|nr:hypothetical protein [Flavobacteriales bacterium]